MVRRHQRLTETLRRHRVCSTAQVVTITGLPQRRVSSGLRELAEAGEVGGRRVDRQWVWWSDPSREPHRTQIPHALALTDATMALDPRTLLTETRIAGTGLVPDATLERQDGQRLFVEVDRGTEAGHRLALKLHDLARLGERAEWGVLCVFDVEDVERRVNAVLSYLRAYEWICEHPWTVGDWCSLNDLRQLGYPVATHPWFPAH